MINSRSTYYIEVQFINPLTSLPCAEYTINVYLWRGQEADVPGSPEYEITRTNYLNSSGSEFVELSRIIDAHLTATLTDTTSGTSVNQNENNQLWVKTTISYDGGAEQLGTTYEVLRGYGYGNEGLNAQIPSNDILLSDTIYRAGKNCLFTIPVFMNVASNKTVTITSLPNNLYNDSFTLTKTDDTDGMVQLVIIDTSNISDDKRINVAIGSDNILIMIDEDERYNQSDVYFINKHGGQQTISMRKERKESLSVNKESFESATFLQPSAGWHQTVDFMVNGKTSVNLSSGYIAEGENTAFKELLLSDAIWIRYNSETVPVKIKTTNLEYQTRANNKLINYVIDFEYAFNEINNV